MNRTSRLGRVPSGDPPCLFSRPGCAHLGNAATPGPGMRVEYAAATSTYRPPRQTKASGIRALPAAGREIRIGANGAYAVYSRSGNATCRGFADRRCARNLTNPGRAWPPSRSGGAAAFRFLTVFERGEFPLKWNQQGDSIMKKVSLLLLGIVLITATEGPLWARTATPSTGGGIAAPDRSPVFQATV